MIEILFYLNFDTYYIFGWLSKIWLSFKVTSFRNEQALLRNALYSRRHIGLFEMLKIIVPYSFELNYQRYSVSAETCTVDIKF